MKESVLRSKLERLSHQLAALRESSLEDPRVRERLLADLARLQGTLAESLTELPARPDLGETASSNGRVARSTWPSRELHLIGRAERQAILVRVMRSPTRCRWANRSWRDFTGRSLKRLHGRGWLRDVHPEDRARLVRTCRDALASGQLYQVEYRLQHESETYRWVLEIGTPRLTSRKVIGGLVGMAIEITEHKRTELRLALQCALAHVLAESMTLEDAAPRILQLLCAEHSWAVGELWSLDAPEHRPRCLHVWGMPHVDLAPIREAARLLQRLPDACSGPTAWTGELGAQEDLAPTWEPQRLGLHGMLCLPIAAGGRVSIVVRLYCRSLRERAEDELEFLEALGLQIGLFLERRRNEERLGESESRKSAILEAALDAVITIDEAGRVVEFNAAAERIFGYPRREVLGRDLLPLIVPPRMSAQAAESFDRYRTQRTSSLLGKRFETSARRADGTEFPVEVAMTPIQVGNPPLLTIYVSDVTARRSAQQEVQLYQKRLREVMTEMLLAEERERRRLASDLHDGLSQTIALAQIKLSGLRAALDGRLAQPLDELEALIRQTDLTARSLGSELSPPILQELGLEPAVRWLVGNIGERYGLAIEMQDDGCPKPADEATRVILFRSIRELLINAAKHARPRRVLVRLEREQDRLTAAVEDDGIGMEPRTPALRGAGLLSIRERLSHVGGSMDIESAPGRGTKIRMSAPLTNGSSKNARIEA